MNAPTAQPTITVGGFSIDILVQGYPGKTVCHGGLGWSTVALVRGQGRVILIDAGNFGMRRLIAERLSARAVSRRRDRRDPDARALRSLDQLADVLGLARADRQAGAGMGC